MELNDNVKTSKKTVSKPNEQKFRKVALRNTNSQILLDFNKILLKNGPNITKMVKYVKRGTPNGLKTIRILQRCRKNLAVRKRRNLIQHASNPKRMVKKLTEADDVCRDVLADILDHCFENSGLDNMNVKENIEGTVQNNPETSISKVDVKIENNDLFEEIAIKKEIKEEREDILVMDNADLGTEVFEIADTSDSYKAIVDQKNNDIEKESLKDNQDVSSDNYQAVVNQKKKDFEKGSVKDIQEKNKLKENFTAKVNTEDVKYTSNKILWVTNIDKNMRAADLKELFAKYGKITGAKIISDGSACYGYISTASCEDANKCLKKLNSYDINGIKIGVSKLKPECLANAKKSEVHEVKKVPSRPREEKRKSHEEKVEKDRLIEKRRRLDEEERTLGEKIVRLRQMEYRNKKVQQKLYEERQKLRSAKEAFEKEKYDYMVSVKERQRIDQENLEKEKINIEKMKKELKKMRADLEERERSLKSASIRASTSKYSTTGKLYHESSTSRRSEDYLRSKSNYERGKQSKSVDYSSYSTSKKDDKPNSFGSRYSSSMSSVSCGSKNYHSSSKENWNEYPGSASMWRNLPVTPAPPRINWNNDIRGNSGSGAYGPGSGSNSGSGGNFPGISCPSPPGVSYGIKFDGPSYSHCGRKY